MLPNEEDDRMGWLTTCSERERSAHKINCPINSDIRDEHVQTSSVHMRRPNENDSQLFWGSREGKKEDALASMDPPYIKPKSQGGLGFRDLRLFN